MKIPGRSKSVFCASMISRTARERSIINKSIVGTRRYFISEGERALHFSAFSRTKLSRKNDTRDSGKNRSPRRAPRRLSILHLSIRFGKYRREIVSKYRLYISLNQALRIGLVEVGCIPIALCNVTWICRNSRYNHKLITTALLKFAAIFEHFRKLRKADLKLEFAMRTLATANLCK